MLFNISLLVIIEETVIKLKTRPSASLRYTNYEESNFVSGRKKIASNAVCFIKYFSNLFLFSAERLVRVTIYDEIEPTALANHPLHHQFLQISCNMAGIFYERLEYGFGIQM